MFTLCLTYLYCSKFHLYIYRFIWWFWGKNVISTWVWFSTFTELWVGKVKMTGIWQTWNMNCSTHWKLCLWQHRHEHTSNKMEHFLYIIQYTTQYLNQLVYGCWMGLMNLQIWPPQSPDLNSLDFLERSCLWTQIWHVRS
jgi:hypothetical protein